MKYRAIWHLGRGGKCPHCPLRFATVLLSTNNRVKDGHANYQNPMIHFLKINFKIKCYVRSSQNKIKTNLIFSNTQCKIFLKRETQQKPDSAWTWHYSR